MNNILSTGVVRVRSATVMECYRSVRLLTHSKRCYSQKGAGSSGHDSSATSSSGFSGQWDSNNLIRVLGSAAALLSFIGLAFDTIYNRASKKELQAVEFKLEAKIDGVAIKLESKIDGIATKIDGLTHAMLHTQQRDRIALEVENRELRREIEDYKRKKD